MVGTITPVVNRSNKGKQIIVVLLPHIIGYFIGASVLGLACGMTGRLMYMWFPSLNNKALIISVASVIGLSTAFFEVILWRHPRPQRNWQVPSNWRAQYSPPLMAFMYGSILGMGVFTAISTYSFYAVLMYALLVGDPISSVICTSIYGVGRGLPITIFSLMSPQGTYRDTYQLIATIGRLQTLIPSVNGIISGFLAGMMLGRII